MREVEIIWFWSRGIVTAVRRVEPCLRLAQISAKISPIVDGGNCGRGEEPGGEEQSGREVATARRQTAA